MYKKWRRITIYYISLPAIVFALIAKCANNTTVKLVFAIVAIALFLTVSILEIIKCRCPSCRRYIRTQRSYDFCPYCGADLDSWKYK